MRRKDFEVNDRERLEEALKKSEIGYLAFNGADGWPRVTPLNFEYDGRVLWHGAIAGERFDGLNKDPRATFSAVAAQVYIPSHLISEENAAGATVAFQSVQIRGRCQEVTDLQERCAILNRLMHKYPARGEISSGDSRRSPLYENPCRHRGIFVERSKKCSGNSSWPKTRRKRTARRSFPG